MSKIKTEKVTVIVAPIQGHQHFHFCKTTLQSSDKADVNPGTRDAWFRCKGSKPGECLLMSRVKLSMLVPIYTNIVCLLIGEGVAKKVIRGEFGRQNDPAGFNLRFEYVPVDSDA